MARQQQKYCQACAGEIQKHGKEIEKVYYCGSACQKEDWKFHKASCKSVRVYRLVYRAGELARTIYYTFRSRTFPITVTNVKRGGDSLSYHWDDTGFHFRELKQSVVSNIEDRRTILFKDKCAEAIVACKDAVVLALNGKYLLDARASMGLLLTTTQEHTTRSRKSQSQSTKCHLTSKS